MQTTVPDSMKTIVVSCENNGTPNKEKNQLAIHLKRVETINTIKGQIKTNNNYV